MENTIKYQDNSEEFLLELFLKKPESKLSKKINLILMNNPTWPIFYHLTPQRKLLLDWFNFKKNSSLLEVGAGCGALTGILCDKCNHVTALELETERAEVISRRYSDKKNLKIVQSNINEYTTDEKFDYVTLIGVLEYAGRFSGDPKSINKYKYSPFINLLKKCNSLLKDGGQIIIAIENKIGIKYLSGCLEDHYGIGFESIEDYPDYSGIRTFSKYELKKMLIKAGFQNKTKFMYPFPDYKIPKQIFNKSFLAKSNISLSSLFPTKDYSQPRQFVFNETLFANTLQKANLLDEFANSFLVFSQK